MTGPEPIDTDDETREISQLLSAAEQASGSEQIAILEQLHEALRQQLAVASRD